MIGTAIAVGIVVAKIGAFLGGSLAVITGVKLFNTYEYKPKSKNSKGGVMHGGKASTRNFENIGQEYGYRD